MSLNGKRDGFTRADFHSLEKLSPLFARSIIDQVIDNTIEQVSRWRSLAAEHEVPKLLADEIAGNLRLNL